MNESGKRKALEDELMDAIREGEAQAFKDPEVKNMIESLRTMYTSDKGSLFSALGLSAPQSPKPGAERVELPESNIPDLIFMLDRLAKQTARPVWRKALESSKEKKPSLNTGVQSSRKPFMPSNSEPAEEIKNPIEVLDVGDVKGV